MGVAIAVWFCLLLSGWRVLGRLVTLPEDRVAFVAVGAFVLEPAVGPRSAGLALWVEGKAVPEGECMPFWGLEASLGRLFGPWAGGSAVPPTKWLVTSLGVAVILEPILEQEVVPRGSPRDRAVLHFYSELPVIWKPVVVLFLYVHDVTFVR